VRCSLCSKELRGTGFCVSHVSESGIYTATLHYACAEDFLSPNAARRLRRLCFDSGWVQSELPPDLLPSDKRSS
jgi:hypothetical protein